MFFYLVSNLWDDMASTVVQFPKSSDMCNWVAEAQMHVKSCWQVVLGVIDGEEEGRAARRIAVIVEKAMDHRNVFTFIYISYLIKIV